MHHTALTWILAFTKVLIWPAVIGMLALFFRNQIRDALSTTRRLSIFGATIRLNQRLDDVERWEARSDTHAATPPEETKLLLKEASRDTLAALTHAELLVAREVNVYTARTGGPVTRMSEPQRTLLKEALWTNEASEEQLRLLFDYFDLRDYLASPDAAHLSKQDALKAMRVHLYILGYLRAIPIERHYVVDPDVPIFDDEQRTQPCAHGLHGVLVRSIPQEQPQSAVERTLVTRGSYEADTEVGWQWSDLNYAVPHWSQGDQTIPWLFAGQKIDQL